MIRFRSTRAGDTSRAVHTHRRREGWRGQSLVEFALVIPILMFLTLTALDFGRVYLGYINLQNMSRIAANFAANNPTAWDATPSAAQLAIQLKYRNQILADAAATNCTLPRDGSGTTVVPIPTFTDMNGNSQIDPGDTAQVQIGCRFGIITPGIANIVGGTVQVAAASSFPVKSGMIGTGPGGGAGSAPNAAFSGNGVIASVGAPASISGTVPFTVDFRDTSGGNPTYWLWTFPDTTPATESHLQDPLLHKFQNAGTYVVTMQAENVLGSSTASMTVTVTAASAVKFYADRQDISKGDTVQFTDDSTTGGTAWDWTFGAGQGTGTGRTPSHTYNTTGTYTVSLTVTYPGPTGPLSHTETGYIRVSVGMCPVAQLGGVRFNDAQAKWQGAPYNFTGVVIKAPGAPSGNFVITAQSITYGVQAFAPCDSDVVVARP
jgi:PKD repeat protein/Flp pilus assembly protein TadG